MVQIHPLQPKGPFVNYVERLQQWFDEAKNDGRAVDIKFFPVGDDGSPELMARAAWETLTGQRETAIADLSVL